MYLISLTIKNSFSHKHTEVHFAEGLNWLLGENEGGKTELLDMIPYSLTGQGLRSKASEYKDLDVQMVFRINDEIFKVHRAKTTSLKRLTYENDKIIEESLATGKTAVNTAIASKLGYNYSVFSKMNYSKQLEGIALTDAKTSERLALINMINGVDEANAFEKVLEGNKKELKAQLKALDTGSIVANLNFEIDKEIDDLANEATISELTEKGVEIYNQIKHLSKLSEQFKALPEKEEFKCTETLSNTLTKFNNNVSLAKDDLYKHKTSLLSIADLEPKVENIKSQIEQLKSTAPSQLFSKEDVKEFERISDNNSQYEKQEAMIKSHEVECPNCQHVFNDNGLVNSLTLLPLNITYEQFVESSNYYTSTLFKINNLEVTLASYISTLETYKSLVNESYQDLSKDALESLHKELDDYSKYVYRKEMYEQQIEKFCTTWNVTLEDFPTIRNQVYDLYTLEIAMTECSTMKDRLTSYMSRKSVYELAVKTQAKIDKDISEIKEKIEIIDSVLDESKKIRLEIQNTCIPVLNNIASKMINKLTGGKRYGLTLNENFELTLDGKPIDSYSGSTIVLANVAFRVALIEMFFKKTFPVFIGDEIDAYSDDTRAQHTHDALVKLEKEGYQLILVSHHALNFQGNKIHLADIKNKG